MIILLNYYMSINVHSEYPSLSRAISSFDYLDKSSIYLREFEH